MLRMRRRWKRRRRIGLQYPADVKKVSTDIRSPSRGTPTASVSQTGRTIRCRGSCPGFPKPDYLTPPSSRAGSSCPGRAKAVDQFARGVVSAFEYEIHDRELPEG